MKRLILAFILISGCIETDIVEDEIVAITVNSNKSIINNSISGLIDEELAFSVEALNDRGISFAPEVEWMSSNPSVVTISDEGTALLSGVGNSVITAEAFGIKSDPIVVNVVASESEIAMIVISDPKNNLEIGESVQLEAQAVTVNGESIPGLIYTWNSMNSDIVSVDDTGLITGIASGMTTIEVGAENISASLSISVGMVSVRSGSFSGLNGYSVTGNVALAIDDEDNITITLEENFSASNGPGLYVYLSNNQSNVNGGVEISELRKNSGADTYSIPESISFDQFDYVVIFCKPFGVGFGTARLN